MAVKEFLGWALKLDQLIDSKLAELSQCRRLAESINGSRLDERVSHSSPEEASYAKWVERIVEKEKELDAEIDRLVDVKLESATSSAKSIIFSGNASCVTVMCLARRGRRLPRKCTVAFDISSGCTKKL